LEPFPTYTRIAITSSMEHVETIDKDVVHMSMPPTMEARAYRTMYDYGNHIHVSNVEEHLTTS
jgi:hypothetical protein